MATYISHSPAETEALGETWGRAAQRGLVIGLSGDLGAGKTQLVKGLARGLGITMRVQSPSFALVNIYSGGRLPLFHLDLYRLDTREQVLGAGLEEYLEPDGVAVIEWAERWFGNEWPGQRPSPGAGTHVRSPGSEGSGAPVQSCVSAPGDGRCPAAAALLRWVRIEWLSETERRITYEDTGA